MTIILLLHSLCTIEIEPPAKVEDSGEQPANESNEKIEAEIDDNVFEDVSAATKLVNSEELSHQKSRKMLLNVSKKKKMSLASDRPGSELSFQSVNEISSMGKLGDFNKSVYFYIIIGKWLSKPKLPNF